MVDLDALERDYRYLGYVTLSPLDVEVVLQELRSARIELAAHRERARIGCTDEEHLLGMAELREARAEVERLKADTSTPEAHAKTLAALAEAQDLLGRQRDEIERLKNLHEAEVIALRERMVAAESEMARVKPLWEQQLNAEREAHAKTRAELEHVTGELMACIAPAEVGGGIVNHVIERERKRADRAEVERDALRAVLVGLRPIAESMRGQDNRATANPVYAVETKTGRMGQFEFVTAFFSLKAAEAYVKANAHNLRQPRVFVHSAYRNSEWQAVREALTKLDELEREVERGHQG